MRTRTAMVCGIVILFTRATLLAGEQQLQAGSTATGEDGHLGQVHFQVSCTPAAQKTFVKGVALLHSFQYEASDQAFNQSATDDPTCAMAYWGQAMTRWHELWDRPDAAALQAGRDDLKTAASLHAKTPREREYIAAAAEFFRDDPKLDFAGRAAAYSAAMGRIHSRYPNDGDAAAFYALSLIALPAEGKADLANREKAIAILNPLFAAEPNHPGAAHYLIHACDTPELAPQGLAAARRYAEIAPDSAHALHMPSHIFTRLGLWQESIQSNLVSAAAAERATKMHLGDATYQLHAMSFLEYAYLQTGQNTKAEQVIDEVKAVPGATPDEIADDQAIFQARYALETHNWKMAVGLVPDPVNLFAQDETWWVRAIGAARTGDAAQARADVEKLAEATAAGKDRNKRQGYKVNDEKTIMQLEAEAWLAFAQGKKNDALKTLRAAADREDSEGVDGLTMPAREMLGDMLMEDHQPAAALAAYEIALKESPNRRDALHGVQLASAAAGKPQLASVDH